MQAGGRRLALDILERILGGAYLAPALSAALDRAGLPGEERSLVTDLTYGVLRRLPQVDHLLSPHLQAPGKLPPRVRSALRLGAFELAFRGTPPYAAVSAWVEVVKGESKRLAGLVNAVLRRVEPLSESAPRAVRAALDEWLLVEFERALGEAAAWEAAQGMLVPSPLWLTALRPEAAQQLSEQGAQVERYPDDGAPVPYSLKVRSPVPLAQLRAFREGAVQPQNPSSLQAALLLGAGAGDTVYDLASGRGAKSAVLAAMGSEVVAFELSEARARAAERNLERLGLSVAHRQADLREVPEAERAPFVLLDAPCSGSGTLRGNPEIKLRLTEPDVAAAAELQRQLLATAAELVAPGGVLVYAVCSLTRQEGAEVVATTLSELPQFREEEVELRLPSVAPAGGGPGRYVLPLEGLDGFYLARLRHEGS